MEIENTLREAIEKRRNTFSLVAATISLPTLRFTQTQAYNETLNFKADDYFQRPLIEQFKIHTELLLEDAQIYLSNIPEDYIMVQDWHNYINELKQQLYNLTDILSLTTASTTFNQQ